MHSIAHESDMVSIVQGYALAGSKGLTPEQTLTLIKRHFPLTFGRDPLPVKRDDIIRELVRAFSSHISGRKIEAAVDLHLRSPVMLVKVAVSKQWHRLSGEAYGQITDKDRQQARRHLTRCTVH